MYPIWAEINIENIPASQILDLRKTIAKDIFPFTHGDYFHSNFPLKNRASSIKSNRKKCNIWPKCCKGLSES